MTPARLRLIALGAALALVAGCQRPGAPVAMARYGIGVPLAGAKPTAAHTATLAAGGMTTGPGANGGATLGFGFRPVGRDVLGGALELNALTTYSGETGGTPFFVGDAGLGLLGLTELRSVDGDMRPTLDLMTPHGSGGVGMPLGAGFAVSGGVSLHYLWRAWNDVPGRKGENQLLLGFLLGVGVFDPHTALEDSALRFMTSK